MDSEWLSAVNKKAIQRLSDLHFTAGVEKKDVSFTFLTFIIGDYFCCGNQEIEI